MSLIWMGREAGIHNLAIRTLLVVEGVVVRLPVYRLDYAMGEVVAPRSRICILLVVEVVVVCLPVSHLDYAMAGLEALCSRIRVLQVVEVVVVGLLVFCLDYAKVVVVVLHFHLVDRLVACAPHFLHRVVY